MTLDHYLAEYKARYAAACHAMQSGVATDHGLGSNDGNPKHLRVGINVAMRDLGSLIGLLVAKGIITDEEIHKALAEGMEREVKDYEERLSSRTGTAVTLH